MRVLLSFCVCLLLLGLDAQAQYCQPNSGYAYGLSNGCASGSCGTAGYGNCAPQFCSPQGCQAQGCLPQGCLPQGYGSPAYNDQAYRQPSRPQPAYSQGYQQWAGHSYPPSYRYSPRQLRSQVAPRNAWVSSSPGDVVPPTADPFQGEVPDNGRLLADNGAHDHWGPEWSSSGDYQVPYSAEGNDPNWWRR